MSHRRPECWLAPSFRGGECSPFNGGKEYGAPGKIWEGKNKEQRWREGEKRKQDGRRKAKHQVKADWLRMPQPANPEESLPIPWLISVMTVDWCKACSGYCWNQRRAKVPTGETWGWVEATHAETMAWREKRPADYKPLETCGYLWASFGLSLAMDLDKGY